MSMSPENLTVETLATWVVNQMDAEISEAVSRFFGRRDWTTEEFVALRPARISRSGDNFERIALLDRHVLDLAVVFSDHAGVTCAAIAAAHHLPPVPGEARLQPPSPSD